LEGFERRWGGTADYASARQALAPALARLYEQTGQLDKLEALLRDAVAAAKKGGDRSPQAAGTLAEYGLLLLGRKKWADAESVLRECLAVREKVIPNEWVTFNARSMLGESLMGQGKYADARPLLVAGYEGLKAREAQVPPDARVRLSQAADRLIRLAEATGSADELEKWRAERAKYRLELAPLPREK
jgi:tetratricopeptide (TPR) repeat protein